MIQNQLFSNLPEKLCNYFFRNKIVNEFNCDERGGGAKDYQVWFINPLLGQGTRMPFMTLMYNFIKEV